MRPKTTLDTCAVVLIVGLLPTLVYGSTTVVSGDARFEILTPSLVRMEYSPSRTFVNAPTAVVRKRDWIPVSVQSTRKEGWLVLTTRAMALRYRLHSGSFTAANLEVTWKDQAGVAHEWYPAMRDPGNLGGLSYDLRGLSAEVAKTWDNRTTPGLLSRSGFAILDDSGDPVWNLTHTWIEPRRAGSGQDWYIFVYGRDYSKVLKEYAELCGPVPMVPRYALGPWVTDLNFQYYPGTAESRSLAFRSYGQMHLEREVSRLLKDGVPISVMVLDFAWHDYGWHGGYDWSGLIPHPRQLLTWLHDRGIRVALSDHPGARRDESILSYRDSHAREVLEALGRPLPTKPSFDMDLGGVWKSTFDPHDVGLTQRWYATNYDDRDWSSIRTDMPPWQPWQVRDFALHRRVRWYRASVRAPVPSGPLYLYFKGDFNVGNNLIFVNGKQVSHTHMEFPDSIYADISSVFKSGRQNVIALRIEEDIRGAGFLKGPVGLQNLEPARPIVFNLVDTHQADVFMRELHLPLMRDGVDFWWVDGGATAAHMPGLNSQLWTNRMYYEYEEGETGRRALILSRYGGWGSERYPVFFTGDTFSQWGTLAYEVAFTARGGNVLVPYISNDIGGFLGGKIPFDLYARWIEFGTFSPILRMHSGHENPREGNLRMPWEYGTKGIALVRKYFRLRSSLMPYIYTYSWQAHKEAMPILRPLYLHWPNQTEAYQHSHEYYFGSQLLVAPAIEASGERRIYLPPGRWIGFLNEKRYTGGTVFTENYAIDQTPVFVRAGAIIPEQPLDENQHNRHPDRLIVNVYGSGGSNFELYEDDGTTLQYRKGRYALTPMMYTTSDGRHKLVVGPTGGAYSGQAESRSYEIRIHASQRPASISMDGRKVGGWDWDSERSVASVRLPRCSIRGTVTIIW